VENGLCFTRRTCRRLSHGPVSAGTPPALYNRMHCAASRSCIPAAKSPASVTHPAKCEPTASAASSLLPTASVAALRLAHFHPAVLRLQGIERRHADPMLAAQIRRLTPASYCFKSPMTCSSVYRLFFIPVLPLRLRENSRFSVVEFFGGRSIGRERHRDILQLVA
jgi:hypothetical protein